MGLRDKTKELALPNGVYSANATADLDLLYGVFDNATDALNSVLTTERKVGKRLAIYTDATKTIAEMYLWNTDLAGNWGFQPVNDKTEAYQIITLGNISTDNVTKKVTISVHKSGLNQIRINGAIWNKSTISEFIIDPIVTSGNLRKDIIEARPNSTLFYLKKGVEAAQPVPPTVTDGAMLISEVLVTNFIGVMPVGSIMVDTEYLKGKGVNGDVLSFSDTMISSLKTTIYDLSVNQDGNLIYIQRHNRVNLDYLKKTTNVLVFDNFQITYGNTVGAIRSSVSELQGDIDALTSTQVTDGYTITFRIVLEAGKSFATAELKMIDK